MDTIALKHRTSIDGVTYYEAAVGDKIINYWPPCEVEPGAIEVYESDDDFAELENVLIFEDEANALEELSKHFDAVFYIEEGGSLDCV